MEHVVELAMDRIVEVVQAAQPYADLVTPLTFEYANAQVAELSSTLGLATDQLRYVLCLFAAYPLAVVYKLLPSASLKHVFDIVVGILLAQFVLGSGWVHSFLSAAITYALVKFAPAKYAPAIVFLFNMTYMSAAHIYRLYVDYMGWTLDFTGPQMLLVIKLTSFAYNYYDGVVDKTGSRKDLSPAKVRVYTNRQKFALTTLPSLLEYFGFVYSFTTFLAGPAFEIREYLDTARGTKFMLHGQQQRQPSSLFAAFSKLLVGVFFMGFYAHFGPSFPISNLHDANVAALPWYRQILELYITLIFTKAKYYGAWKIAEGATVLCGFGFEGFDPLTNKPRGWNGVSNMDIVGFELAQSVREGSRAWNKGTQTWLERYVYSRTGNSLLATYFISAFWHGFYPGYYLFFLSLPLATSVNRLAFKRVRPYFLNADGSSGVLKKFYDVVSVIATLLTMHYFVMPFQAMSWEYSKLALQNTHFAGHIVCAVLYVVFSLVPVRKMTPVAVPTAKKTE